MLCDTALFLNSSNSLCKRLLTITKSPASVIVVMVNKLYPNSITHVHTQFISYQELLVHALNKIVRTHTLLRVLIARLERLGAAGYKRGVPWAEVFAEAFAMRTNMAAKFKL